MGHARPRSHRHAGWSDDGADGGDVVVRTGARAVTEFGQRRRRRDDATMNSYGSSSDERAIADT